MATIAKQPQSALSVSHNEQPEQKLPPDNSDDITETQTETLATTTTNSTDHLGTVSPGTVHPDTNNPTTSAETEVKLKKPAD